MHFLYCSKSWVEGHGIGKLINANCIKLLFTAVSAPASIINGTMKMTSSCYNFHVIKIAIFFCKPTKSFFMFSSLWWKEGQKSLLLQSGYKISWGSGDSSMDFSKSSNCLTHSVTKIGSLLSFLMLLSDHCNMHDGWLPELNMRLNQPLEMYICQVLVIWSSYIQCWVLMIW